MSSRDGPTTYTPGQILAKEIELKQAEEKLAERDAEFDRNPHKAGSHEHNMQYRRWSDQRQIVKDLRQELAHMKKAERS
jgi:hypothetical protein